MGEIEERSRDLGLRDPGSDSAWSATEREILVHRMEQELEVQPRGTFKPSGGWVRAGSVKRRARKRATARVGDVTVDSTSPSAGSSTNAAGTSTATKSADEDSAEVRPWPGGRSTGRRTCPPPSAPPC